MSLFSLSSASFTEGGKIPRQHGCEGPNTSPPLSWSGAPAGTKSFALIVDDPDAPSAKNPRPEPWVHWVLFNLAAERTELAEGQNGGGIEGRNDFKEVGWGGPLPPPGSGVHRYFFKLYA